MDSSASIVITSIAAPTRALQEYARECAGRGTRLFIIGDRASPPDFQLAGCDYYDIPKQLAAGFNYPKLAPVGHYARKNIGYLLAMRAGASYIVETDDDNIPRPEFWNGRTRSQTVPCFTTSGWVNIYRYFSDALIWPRGLPLDAIHGSVEPLDKLQPRTLDCPIQQSLADDDPDVDAIFRLVFPEQRTVFSSGRKVALTAGARCPFNSQNTTWWPDAYPLMYLPSRCTMRMTDIWRSFVAQRIAAANGWAILFESATVYQERNAHNVMRDFQDEVSGYLNNRKILEALDQLSIHPGVGALDDSLRLCYGELVRLGCLDKSELELLEAWIADCR